MGRPVAPLRNGSRYSIAPRGARRIRCGYGTGCGVSTDRPRWGRRARGTHASRRDRTSVQCGRGTWRRIPEVTHHNDHRSTTCVSSSSPGRDVRARDRDRPPERSATSSTIGCRARSPASRVGTGRRRRPPSRLRRPPRASSARPPCSSTCTGGVTSLSPHAEQGTRLASAQFRTRRPPRRFGATPSVARPTGPRRRAGAAWTPPRRAVRIAMAGTVTPSDIVTVKRSTSSSPNAR